MSNPTIPCFRGLSLRRAIEQHVLCLYESDYSTFKDYTEWPGYYWLNDSSQRIPAVYVVGEAQVPSKYNPHGIECIIYDVPESRKLSGRGQVFARDRWRVRFTNYGFSEGVTVATSLLDISRRMNVVFDSIEQVYSERNEVSYETLICYISITTVAPVYVPS